MNMVPGTFVEKVNYCADCAGNTDDIQSCAELTRVPPHDESVGNNNYNPVCDSFYQRAMMLFMKGHMS